MGQKIEVFRELDAAETWLGLAPELPTGQSV